MVEQSSMKDRQVGKRILDFSIFVMCQKFREMLVIDDFTQCLCKC